MQNLSRRYPLFNVDLVHLDPNEQFHFKVSTTENFICGYMFQGAALRQQNGEHLPALTGGFWQNPAQYGLHPIDFTAGAEGASWLCVSYIAPAEYASQHIAVAGTYTLPAGAGFAVATGQVVADGKTATQGLYFGPRAQDVIVTGNADLIVLTTV
jgi:hypothetical protein